MNQKFQLVYFQDCPNAELAKKLITSLGLPSSEELKSKIQKMTP